jgi:hypothetical protein
VGSRQGGNRFIKWVDPFNEIRVIPSCIKEVSETQWKRIKPDPQTILIEAEGKRYIIGKQAQELDGEPVFQRNKCELAEIIALVAIEPNPGFDYVHIAKFAIALPSDTNESDVQALRKLENYPTAREFKRNGRHICYTIAHIEPLNETEPAFLYAQQQGMFSSQTTQMRFGMSVGEPRSHESTSLLELWFRTQRLFSQVQRNSLSRLHLKYRQYSD